MAMSETLRQLAWLTKHLPDLLADRLDERVQRVHAPVDVSLDPSRPRPMCSWHRKWIDWPCREAVEATDRRAARRPRLVSSDD